jgi:hypothetical protein
MNESDMERRIAQVHERGSKTSLGPWFASERMMNGRDSALRGAGRVASRALRTAEPKRLHRGYAR